MASDPDLLDAYRQDCNTYGPSVAWVMWEGEPGITPDDLLNVAAKVDSDGPAGPPFCHRPSPPPYRVVPRYPPTT
jgi:hypothetical protein